MIIDEDCDDEGAAAAGLDGAGAGVVVQNMVVCCCCRGCLMWMRVESSFCVGWWVDCGRSEKGLPSFPAKTKVTSVGARAAPMVIIIFSIFKLCFCGGVGGFVSKEKDTPT
jgi:hypothetical protein